jgi:hypothetical protein
MLTAEYVSLSYYIQKRKICGNSVLGTKYVLFFTKRLLETCLALISIWEFEPQILSEKHADIMKSVRYFREFL